MATIRPATIQDLPGTYRVCLLTGDAGADASGVYANHELLGHVFVGPYVVGEPGLALVVADDDGVAGYCLAAADTRAFEAWGEREWWPRLRAAYPQRTDGAPETWLVELIHAPYRAPDAIVADYPAHLHIDLLGRVRGQGFGRALVERVLAELRTRGVRGVHLDVATANVNAIEFYRHLGFETVHPREDSVLMGLRF